MNVPIWPGRFFTVFVISVVDFAIRSDITKRSGRQDACNIKAALTHTLERPMAQAEPNLTTRRGFSKWLAAVSAAATIPITGAIASSVSSELSEAAAALKAAYEFDDIKFDELISAKEVVVKWQAENLEPNSSDEKYDNLPDYLPVFHADKCAYLTQEVAVKRQAGLGKAHEARLASQEAWAEAAIYFANQSCHSMQDVLFKARIAFDYDTDLSTIADAVVYDLLKFHNIET